MSDAATDGTAAPAIPGYAAKPDLRARRRLRNRLAVQEVALRMFVDRGYEATTVESICAEAGISPATFYRYFPTKEDVVLFDSLDEQFFGRVEALLAGHVEGEPAGSLVQAMSDEIVRVWAELSPAAREREAVRARLSYQVQQLRARQVDVLMSGTEMLAGLIAHHQDRSPGDLQVRVLAGAITGAVLAVVVDGEQIVEEYLPAVAEALRTLGEMLPIEAALRRSPQPVPDERRG